MNIKIIVATHKAYAMPGDDMYIPMHVGVAGKEDIGYSGDDTGDNISYKNPYYCELTGLYWAYRNLKCDYIGLVHYRRYFANRNLLARFGHRRLRAVADRKYIENILSKYDAILPKRRHYVIEDIYDHYVHTHYPEPLDETRKIIIKNYPEYLDAFDRVMKRRSAHMYNMYIMKKNLSDRYCKWVFDILNELEPRVDISEYNAFQARVYGRISELLLNVWVEHNRINYKELPIVYIEKVHWLRKIRKFLRSKFFNIKY